MRTHTREATPQHSRANASQAETPAGAASDVLDVLFDPVAVTDAVRDEQGAIVDFRLVFCNRAAVDFFGRPLDELVGSTALSVYPGDDSAGLFDAWVRVVEEGSTFVAHNVVYRSAEYGTAGGVFDVAAIPFGKGCLHTWRDTTAQRRLQQEAVTTRARSEVALREARADLLRKDQDLVRQRAVMKAEERVLDSLRDTVLPRRLQPVRNIDLGVCHSPASTMHIAGNAGFGGDWYDAFTVGARVVAIIGDVTGHGYQAGAIMTQLRNVVRAYARLGNGPAWTLRESNRFIRDMGLRTNATVMCLEIEPDAGTVRWGQAGHLPLVLRKSTGAGFPDRPEGLILGALDDAAYGEREITLDEGDLLLCFTDGLIESRDVDLAQRLEELAAMVNAAPDLSAQKLCEHLVEALSRDRSIDDDTSVMALTWNPERSGQADAVTNDPHGMGA